MTKKRPFFERIVSMLLVAVMVIGLLPTSVFAQSGGEVDGETGSVMLVQASFLFRMIRHMVRLRGLRL